MTGFVKYFLSDNLNKHTFAFTVAVVMLLANIYLTHSHGFSVLAFDSNLKALGYLDLVCFTLFYSTALIVGKILLYPFTLLVDKVKGHRASFDERFKHYISYGNLERVALFQSNYAAYAILNDYKMEVAVLNKRLFMAFVFMLAFVADIFIMKEMSIALMLFRVSNWFLLAVVGVLVVDAVYSFLMYHYEDGFWLKKRFSIKNVDPDVGRALFNPLYDRCCGNRAKDSV